MTEPETFPGVSYGLAIVGFFLPSDVAGLILYGMTSRKDQEQIAGHEYHLAKKLRVEMAEARRECQEAAYQFVECEDAFENLRLLIAKAEFELETASSEQRLAIHMRLPQMRADLNQIAKRKAELSNAIDLYADAIRKFEDMIKSLIS